VVVCVREGHCSRRRRRKVSGSRTGLPIIFPKYLKIVFFFFFFSSVEGREKIKKPKAERPSQVCVCVYIYLLKKVAPTHTHNLLSD
jgi:hypothetical protein